MIDTVASKTGAAIRRVCKVLSLSRSSYYHSAQPSQTHTQDLKITTQIELIFARHRRRYGYRRVCDDLSDLGITCSPARVRRLMKQKGLRALSSKKFVPSTSDGRADRPNLNLLLDEEMPTSPDSVWVGDITYIPTSEGWRYLAVVIDLYSRRVVGWSLANHMKSELVCDAMQQALQGRRGITELIFHSDRGSQYGSQKFRTLLRRAAITQSMSRRANPYDNAWTESFMGTLKLEMLQGEVFANERAARTELFCYIDGYYNTVRKHSSLGYKTPQKFESHYYQN